MTPPPLEPRVPVAPTRRRVWLRRAIELVIIIAIFAAVCAWQQRDVANGIAPPLAGSLVDGTPFTLSFPRKQPVLVHFWATWCPICRAEQGSIESLARDHASVITVAMQSGSRDKVAQFMRDASLGFPAMNDDDGTIAAAWGVRAVPASFIVGRDGRIRFVEVGYTTEIGLRLRLWWASL